ncbi:unnamed protein product [Alternaria alternata]
MSGPDPSWLYHKQYEEGRKLFDGDIVNCIAAAKKNLLYVTYPAYFPPLYILMQHNIADDWLGWAERAFKKSLDLATRQQDNNSLETLAGLREELDEVKEFKMEDLTGMTKEERDMVDAELEELDAVAEAENMMEVAAEYLEDSEAVAGAESRMDVAVEHLEDLQAVVKTENRIEIAAEHLCIPFRPAGEPTHNTPSDSAVISKSRR